MLLGHAIYAPAAVTGWMHADLHPGNFLLLPGGRLGMLDFGAVAATPAASRPRSGSSPRRSWPATSWPALRLARQVGALAPGTRLDPRLVIELLYPMVATAAEDTFTYSRPWLRSVMSHFTESRFAPVLRSLSPPANTPWCGGPPWPPPGCSRSSAPPCRRAPSTWCTPRASAARPASARSGGSPELAERDKQEPMAKPSRNKQTSRERMARMRAEQARRRRRYPDPAGPRPPR